MSSSAEITPPDPAGARQIMGLLTGFANTQILLTADQLRLFDTLTRGARTAEQVAQELGLPVDSLERLLIGCASLGLLAKHGDTYALTEVSRDFLVTTAPAYMGRGFGHFKNELYPLWGHLTSAVRQNQPQWAGIPGMDPRGPFESMYRDPEGVRIFMETMFSLTYPAAREYAERFDFGRYPQIVDVGGASGAFFAGVLPKFPEVRGTIFDLPPVETPALDTMARFHLSDRVGFVGGDFFHDPLPQPADMYVLGFILHDWNTEQGTALLRRIYEALPDHGAVFVAEQLYSETKDGPPMVAFGDLNMLVATYGKERTPAEYESWLKEVGFARTEYEYCSGIKSYVVGHKK